VHAASGHGAIGDLRLFADAVVGEGTGLRSRADSGSSTGFRLISGTRLPRSMVGSAERRRVSSCTWPFSIGTLKSTRTRAVLPLRSAP
jgi:hypothetical protein